MSDSVRPQRWQPTRLPRPWDSPGKNTGVGCHFLLQCMKVKSESEVAQSCPTLSDPTDCSLRGSSVYGIFQARVLEWGAIAFSAPTVYRGSNFSASCQYLSSFVVLKLKRVCFYRNFKLPGVKFTKLFWLSRSTCFLHIPACLTLFYPLDCSCPGSSVHRILQARIVEWVAIPFSRGSS